MKKLKKAVLTYEKTLMIDTEYSRSYNTTFLNYRTYNFNKRAKRYKKEEYYEKEQEKQ